MAKRIVQVELSPAQELALLDRFGRKCSPEGAVKRAIAEILKQQEENIPIFVGREEATRRAQAEMEAQYQRTAEANKISPEAVEILSRFQGGEKFVDLEGREVSNLSATASDCPEPIMAQFGGDNSEWYPIELNELVSTDPAERAYDRGIEHQNSAQQSLVTASEVVGADPVVHPDTANEGIEPRTAGE